jgi:hypothetical protein
MPTQNEKFQVVIPGVIPLANGGTTGSWAIAEVKIVNAIQNIEVTVTIASIIQFLLLSD